MSFVSLNPIWKSLFEQFLLIHGKDRFRCPPPQPTKNQVCSIHYLPQRTSGKILSCQESRTGIFDLSLVYWNNAGCLASISCFLPDLLFYFVHILVKSVNCLDKEKFRYLLQNFADCLQLSLRCWNHLYILYTVLPPDGSLYSLHSAPNSLVTTGICKSTKFWSWYSGNDVQCIKSQNEHPLTCQIDFCIES